MLSGDDERFQTQGSLLQFFSQSSQLPLLLRTASLQPLNLNEKNKVECNGANAKRSFTFSQLLTSSLSFPFSLSSACLSLSFC